MPFIWCFFLSKEGVSEILQHHHHLAVLPTWISTSRRCPWTLVLSPAAAFPQVIGVLGLPWHHKTKAEPVVVEVNSGSCRMPVMQSPSCKKSKLETQLGWKFPFVKENVQKKGGFLKMGKFYPMDYFEVFHVLEILDFDVSNLKEPN